MGLMDVLNGMQNGPRGQRAPSSAGAGSGGMSPITMAILGLLAYKAVKGFTGGQPSAAPANPPRAAAGWKRDQRRPPGRRRLGDLLKGGLGGLLATGAAGGIVSGGLNDLLKQFQQSGHSETVNSGSALDPTRRYRRTIWPVLSGPTGSTRLSRKPACRAMICSTVSANMSESGRPADARRTFAD